MLLAQMKCGMCGNRFELKILDREDPKERYIPGSPIQCPRCHSEFVEKLEVRRLYQHLSMRGA